MQIWDVEYAIREAGLEPEAVIDGITGCLTGWSFTTTGAVLAETVGVAVEATAAVVIAWVAGRWQVSADGAPVGGFGEYDLEAVAEAAAEAGS